MSLTHAGPAAAAIAALYDPELRQRIAGHNADQTARVMSTDAEIQHVHQ